MSLWPGVHGPSLPDGLGFVGVREEGTTCDLYCQPAQLPLVWRGRLHGADELRPLLLELVTISTVSLAKRLPVIPKVL